MAPYPGLRMDLCHQQVTRSAVAVAGSAFLRASLCCPAHAQPPRHLSVHLLSSHPVPIRSHRATCLSPRHPRVYTADPGHTTPLTAAGSSRELTPFLLQCPSDALYWQSPASCSLSTRDVKWILSTIAQRCGPGNLELRYNTLITGTDSSLQCHQASDLFELESCVTVEVVNFWASVFWPLGHSSMFRA